MKISTYLQNNYERLFHNINDDVLHDRPSRRKLQSGKDVVNDICIRALLHFKDEENDEKTYEDYLTKNIYAELWYFRRSINSGIKRFCDLSDNEMLRVQSCEDVCPQKDI